MERPIGVRTGRRAACIHEEVLWKRKTGLLEAQAQSVADPGPHGVAYNGVAASQQGFHPGLHFGHQRLHPSVWRFAEAQVAPGIDRQSKSNFSRKLLLKCPKIVRTATGVW